MRHVLVGLFGCAALAAGAALAERGFLVPAIRYPTVARGAARLRVALMSAHDPERLREAAAAFGDVLGQARRAPAER